MKRCVALLAICVLAACSGGSSGTVPAATSSAAAGPTTTSLQISVPHLTASAALQRRSPAYISASTQSITIDIKPHGSPTSIAGFPFAANLTASSAGCTSTLTATVCDVQLTLKPANYDATFTTFDAPGGSGNHLSAAQTMPLNVVEGKANTVPLALGGISTSVQILATGGQTAAGQGFVFTLQGNTTGTLSAFGVDADGNTIIGAGAPAISAATDNPSFISITQPSASAPNAVGVASLAAQAIAHVTFTVTPVAGTGTSAITRTVTVQAPTLPLMYLATSTSIRVIDMTGTVVTRPGGSGFDSLPTQATSMVYNPTNGLLYVGIQGSTQEVVAYDKNGNSVPLANATGLTTVEGMSYDPANGWLYLANNAVALDAAGNQHALAYTVGGTYGSTFDPQHNLIVGGTSTFDATGAFHSTLPFTGMVNCVTYNPFNGFFYVATFVPTTVTAYDTNGNPQSLSGPWTLVNSSEEVAAMGADPATGNIFLTTNGNKTYGFDAQGNTLPLPWNNLTTGAPSNVGGIVLLTPQ